MRFNSVQNPGALMTGLFQPVILGIITREYRSQWLGFCRDVFFQSISDDIRGLVCVFAHKRRDFWMFSARGRSHCLSSTSEHVLQPWLCTEVSLPGSIELGEACDLDHQPLGSSKASIKTIPSKKDARKVSWLFSLQSIESFPIFICTAAVLIDFFPIFFGRKSVKNPATTNRVFVTTRQRDGGPRSVGCESVSRWTGLLATLIWVWTWGASCPLKINSSFDGEQKIRF